MNHSLQSHSSRRVSRALGGLALSAAALLATSNDLAAQNDFSVRKLEVNQVVQFNGATQLVEGRSTFVRAFLGIAPVPASPISLDGLMRVYVDGMEIADSPIYSHNGPNPTTTFDPSMEDGTLNFIFLAPPPTANCVITVEVNPAGPNFIPEANLANNLRATNALSFIELKVPEMVYVPIDYRPPGNPPLGVPEPFLMEPGTGDGFVMGIFPAKDWYYHRSDVEKKVWAQSLSGSGSALISSLQADRLLMDPVPDYVYGWVPGSLPYNGQSTIGGPASMGNTQNIRHQRTFAHEVGHNHGLSHNNIIVNTYGIDVEHHLNLTEGLTQFKPFNQNDIMVPGLLTPKAWVGQNNYNFFLNHATYQLPLELTITEDKPTLLVNGVWNTQTGVIEVHHVLEVPSTEMTAPVSGGVADFTLRSYAGGSLVRELAVSGTGVTDCAESESDSAVSSPLINFHAIIPATAPSGVRLDRLVFEQAGAAAVGSLELVRSAAAPVVSFITPNAEPLQSPVITVAWQGLDLDGDDISYYLRYTNDGVSFSPLATAISETEWTVDLRTLPGLVDGLGYFELRATDGLNTTIAKSAPITGGKAFAGVGGNDPWIEMYHPDPGFSFQVGATVLLHSSGWDLEDNALTGASIQWTSDLDGNVGSGRLTATNSLSVGAHMITATATDSNGQVSSVSRPITVTDRDLPTVSATVCQTDIGFGGPGTMTVMVCGGDLSTGTTADMSITGGPANALAYSFLGLVNAPTPLFAGTLVPFPWVLLQLIGLDANGDAFYPNIPGGGGPFTAYSQIVAVDPSQPGGYAFSNALQIEFLP